jgi:hypothetical protein
LRTSPYTRAANLAEYELIQNISAEIFAQRSITKTMLLAFVKVRTHTDINASIDYLPKTKGNVSQFEQGCEDILIKIAFDVQSCPVIAKENTIPYYNNDGSYTESTSMKNTDETNNTMDQFADLKESDVKSLLM